MIEWLSLEKEQQLDEIVQLSHDIHIDAVAIFKHSTRCSISSMAKNRLERSWNPNNKNIPVYYLDLISFRQLSNDIANRFNLTHESPQLLLIQKGELMAHASHSAISAAIIEELI
jgi:bacillithiol system protein YtxJ